MARKKKVIHYRCPQCGLEDDALNLDLIEKDGKINCLRCNFQITVMRHLVWKNLDRWLPCEVQCPVCKKWVSSLGAHISGKIDIPHRHGFIYRKICEKCPIGKKNLALRKKYIEDYHNWLADRTKIQPVMEDITHICPDFNPRCLKYQLEIKEIA